MSGWLQVRLRRAAVVAVAVIVAVEGKSQDKSAGGSEATARPDALAGARKDFEGLKSAREESRLPTSGLPRFGVPELPAQTPTPSIVIKPKVPTAESRPGNWLVEAMEKQKTSRDSGGADARSRGRGGRPGPDAESVATEEIGPQRARESGPEKKTEQASTAIVINPLTRYLGEWMTPQDYALLKPGLTPAFDPREGARNPASTNTSGLSLTLGGLNDFAFGGPTSVPASSAPSPQRENPYLDSIQRELPATVQSGSSRTVAPPPPAPAARVPAAIVPPPAHAPSATKIPDFAKPPPDDRYFKQLKRF